MLIIAPDVDFIVSHLTLECLIVIQLTTEFSCLLIFRGRIPGMVTIVILPYLYWIIVLRWRARSHPSLVAADLVIWDITYHD